MCWPMKISTSLINRKAFSWVRGTHSQAQVKQFACNHSAIWLTPCYYALQCGVSTPCACTQSVKLMDTKVTEGQKWRKQSWLARAYIPHQKWCWWCAMLCVLVCGCDLLKPAAARKTAEPPATTRVAPNSNQVAAPSPPPAATTTTPTGPTPQPVAVRTAIVDPPPAPASNPAPMAQPAKGAQSLLVPGASAKVQTSHTVINSVANTPTPQTTLTYISREAAAAIVIKGPPRPLEPPRSRIAVPLCFGMNMGLGSSPSFSLRNDASGCLPVAKPTRTSFSCQVSSS